VLLGIFGVENVAVFAMEAILQ